MNETLTGLSRQQLIKEWTQCLPETLKDGQSAEVRGDEKNPDALLIHVEIPGRTDYSFDFRVTYVDSRETKVDLLDAQEGQIHIDERPQIMQSLIEDTVRHLHECAQVVHAAVAAGEI